MKKSIHFDIVILQSKEMWLVSYITFFDIIAQVTSTRWSIFLVLAVLTVKLRIVLIYRMTDQNNLPNCLYNKKYYLCLSALMKVFISVLMNATYESLILLSKTSVLCWYPNWRKYHFWYRDFLFLNGFCLSFYLFCNSFYIIIRYIKKSLHLILTYCRVKRCDWFRI